MSGGATSDAVSFSTICSSESGHPSPDWYVQSHTEFDVSKYRSVLEWVRLMLIAWGILFKVMTGVSTLILKYDAPELRSTSRGP